MAAVEQPRTPAKPGTEPGEILGTVLERLGPLAAGANTLRPGRAVISVGPGEAPEAARIVFEEFGARLVAITGTDIREGVELLYQFSFDRDLMLLSLRTVAPKPFPQIESITPFVPAAEWAEREVAELLGVGFTGHPGPGRLLLSDDWPEGVYPLRREFRRD